MMEEALIRLCGVYGVHAGRITGLTGVWCGRALQSCPAQGTKNRRNRHSRLARHHIARLRVQRHHRPARLPAHQSLRHHRPPRHQSRERNTRPHRPSQPRIHRSPGSASVRPGLQRSRSSQSKASTSSAHKRRQHPQVPCRRRHAAAGSRRSRTPSRRPEPPRSRLSLNDSLKVPRFIIRQEPDAASFPHWRRERFMPTDVIMPQMGESIFEGTITKWLKKAGDTVQKDEPLFEISTDKVDAEIPSPVAGVLSEIKIPEGATVQVNTVVAVVADSGSPAAVAPPTPKPVKQTEKPFASATAAESTPPQASPSRCLRRDAKWSCRRWANPSSKAPSPSGSRRSATRSRKTSRSLKSPPTRSTPRFPHPSPAFSPRSKSAEGATVEVNTVVAVIGGSATAGDRSLRQSARTACSACRRSSAAADSATLDVAATPVGAFAPRRWCAASRRKTTSTSRHVPGTGSDGRITKDDILRYLSPTPPRRRPQPAERRRIDRRSRAAHPNARHHRPAHG